MPKALKFAIRFTIMSAVLAMLVMASSQVLPSHSPYLSALSDLTVSGTPALAANCQNKVCDGNIPPQCLHLTGHNCPIQGNRCAIAALC